MALLTVEDLYMEIDGPTGLVSVLHGVSLAVDQGEIVGLVGETGSGKTMTMLSTLRLMPPGAVVRKGSIRFDGIDTLTAEEGELRRIRGSGIGVVFQHGRASLNPTRRILDQLVDRLVAHGVGKKAARSRALELLATVGIPEPEVRGRQYPHELSGGMCQRVMVAMAIAAGPRLLMADEPTTGLDVTLQLQIVRLIEELARSRGMGVLLITHDLALAAQICDRLVVMYAGEVVEDGPTEEVMARPLHPYTAGLKRAVVSLEQGRRPEAIPGAAPRFTQPPQSCPFAERCALAVDVCRQARPPLQAWSEARRVACHLVTEGGASACSPSRA